MIKIKRVQTDNRDINQLQQNIASAVEPSFANTTGSFLITLIGCTAPVTGIAKWQVVPDSGQVTLAIPMLIGLASSSTPVTASLTGIPPTIWPKSSQTVLLPVQNNGANAVLVAIVNNSGGSISLCSDLAGTMINFATTNTKGCMACNITYQTGL